MGSNTSSQSVASVAPRALVSVDNSVRSNAPKSLTYAKHTKHTNPDDDNEHDNDDKKQEHHLQHHNNALNEADLQYHFDATQLNANFDPNELESLHEANLEEEQQWQERFDIDNGLTVLFIGKNSNGEAGMGHKRALKTLTKLPAWIEDVHSGNAYTIYSGNEHQLLRAAGTNFHGACGLNHIKPYVDTQSVIKYFIENDISIRKICVSCTGSCTFWIGSDYKVYGNGLNDKYQLGLASKSNKSEPCLIRNLCTNITPSLWRALDVQSASTYSIALLSVHDTASMIISHFVRELGVNLTTDIPTEILELIVRFYSYNRVYSTEHGHGTVDGSIEDKWCLLKDFRDVQITQISTGHLHSLFLDSSGNVWSCGNNLYGQIGSTENDGALPKVMEFFAENEIKIKRVKCGAFHNLAVDIYGRVYVWGYNYDGQCGVGTVDNIKKGPVMLDTLKEEEVVEVDAGYHHSYCRTKEGRHYLWGKSSHNECMTFDERSHVTTPWCINEIVAEQYEGLEIKKVSLGAQNTKIILVEQTSMSCE